MRSTKMALMAALILCASCQDNVGNSDLCSHCEQRDLYDVDMDSASDMELDSSWTDMDMSPDSSDESDLNEDMLVEDMHVDMKPQPIIIEENCTCRNPGETCVLFPGGNIRCQLLEMPCQSYDQCGGSYYCGDNGFCECLETAGRLCNSYCESHQDCPSPLECDPVGNTCRDLDACRNDLDCYSGAYCIASADPYKSRETCEMRGAGGRGLGETCESDSDCDSTMCGPLNKCHQRCFSDADCAEDEICNIASLDGRTYCIEAAPYCAEPCEQRDSLCAEGCAPAKCRLSSDCDEGDCIVQGAGRVAIGTCGIGPHGVAQCKPNEWREEPDDPYCRTRRCTIDAECAGDARCLPTRLGTREPYCARQVLPTP